MKKNNSKNNLNLDNDLNVEEEIEILSANTDILDEDSIEEISDTSDNLKFSDEESEDLNIKDESIESDTQENNILPVKNKKGKTSTKAKKSKKQQPAKTKKDKKSKKVSIRNSEKEETKTKSKKSVVIKSKNSVIIAFCLSLVFFLLATALLAVNYLSYKQRGTVRLGNNIYVILEENKSVVNNHKFFIFKTATVRELKDKDIIAFWQYNSTTGTNLNLAEFSTKNTISSHNFDVTTPDSKTINVKNKDLVGKLSKTLKSEPLIFYLTNKLVFSAVLVVIIFLLTVMIIRSFSLVLKLIKKPEVQSIVQSSTETTSKTKDNKNDSIQLEASGADVDNEIKSFDNSESFQSNFDVNSYYTSVTLGNGELYTKVKKFSESVLAMEEFGASDVDIIRVNMIGNEEFDKILQTKRGTSSSNTNINDIIKYLNSIQDLQCIKRNGKINWIFKYKQKTAIILREEKDQGYRISFKLYPDAAEKINAVFMALEDSNFPSGPSWYMFNNHRNLPFEVIQWMLKESLNISKYQQKKTDLVKDEVSINDLGYDYTEIKNNIVNGNPLTLYNKFAIIVHSTKSSNFTDTLLTAKIDNLEVEKYNREIFMMVPFKTETAVSVLVEKSTSEALINALLNDLLDILKPKITMQEQLSSDKEILASKSTVIKKTTDTSRRRRK